MRRRNQESLTAPLDADLLRETTEALLRLMKRCAEEEDAEQQMKRTKSMAMLVDSATRLGVKIVP